MIDIPTINSFVRVLHALPGGGDVDVFINGELLQENLSYKNMSRYLPIGPGNNSIEVFPAGQRIEPLVETEVDLPESATITLAIIGEAANAEILPILQPFADIGSGEVRIRFANLSPDSPELDLFLNDNKVISEVGYKQVTDYNSITPDTYSVQLRPSDNNDIVVARRNLLFRGGTGYIVYAVGLLEGEPALEIIYFEDELPVVERKGTPEFEISKPPAPEGVKIVFKYV